MNTQNKSTSDIALIGLMIALIEVCKVALSFLPNIELTSFFVIIFTLYFGRKILFVIPGFILVEGIMYGFGLWWLMYVYIWPLLALIAFFFKKRKSVFFWASLSGIFGLSFGFLCSFPYFFIGLLSGGLRNGFITMLTWWGAGITWDIVHGIGNFVVMLVLFKPITKVLDRFIRQVTNGE